MQRLDISNLKEMVLPSGGIKVFPTLYVYDDNVKEIFEKISVANKEDAYTLILLCAATCSGIKPSYLLNHLVQQQILSKEDIIELYMMQDEKTRIKEPLLTLTEINKIRDKENKEVFLWEEIEILASKVVSITPSDVHTLMYHYYHQDENKLPINLLIAWYADSYNTYPTIGIDGKDESLIAIALYRRDQKKINLKDVLVRVENLMTREPWSHGIYRYFSLCFWIAKTTKQKRKISRKLIAHIVQSVNPNASNKIPLNDVRSFIKSLLQDDRIPFHIRFEMEKEIQRGIAQYATTFTNFLDDVFD